jgi:Cu/Ag efflux pump CusA
MAKLRDIPGLVDLDSSVKPAKPTIEVDVRREVASDLGLTTAQIGSSLRTLVAGQTVGNWRAPDDQTYDVNVRLAPDARNTPQDLERLPFALGTNADGSSRVVRLNQVASVRESTGPNQINRRDLTREVAINANVFGRAAGEVSAEIRKTLDEITMPPGYSYQFGGSTKNMAESFGYAVSALALAVIFIYMILASQFKSFLQPLSHDSAATHADWRGAGASSIPLHAIHVLRDRRDHADGLGHEECYSFGGFRNPITRSWHGAHGSLAAGCQSAPAPNFDDHPGHDLWYGAARLRSV